MSEKGHFYEKTLPLSMDTSEEKQSKLYRIFMASNSISKILFFILFINMVISLLLLFFFQRDGFESLREGVIFFTINMLYGAGLYLSMANWNSYLGPRVDWLHRPWWSFLITLLTNALVVIITVTIIIFIYRTLFFKQSLTFVWGLLSPGEYFVPLIIGLMITAIYQAAFFLNIWKTSLLETEQYKRAQLSAQYETLNSQVNPHFLFNSLNVLSSLIKKDPDTAEQFVHQLSDIYRNVLEVRKEELIPLTQELKTLESYQFLLTTRFGKRIIINNELLQNPEGAIVPLCLQMLLENAVKHNASTLKSPLQIRFYQLDGFIWIENNRIPMYEPVVGKGMGLENIRQRYKIATGKSIVVKNEADRYAVGLPVIN